MRERSNTWSWPRTVFYDGSAILLLLMASLGTARSEAAAAPRDVEFDRDVRPILANYCFGCHADGANEGQVSFDELLATDTGEQANETWYRVFQQVRAGMMPPIEEEQPSPKQRATITDWIKYQAFGLDPNHPDPGRVTVRRLNQVEYRNTIRDLLGVDYDTTANFPADDTGHGFDNIGDVLSVSPLLLEKYVNAAKEIVSSVVPTTSGVIREASIAGDQFRLETSESEPTSPNVDAEKQSPVQGESAGTFELSYYEPAVARAVLAVNISGDYILRLNIRAVETYVDGQFDANWCEFALALGDDVLVKQEFVRQGGKDFSFDVERTMKEGEHELVATIRPLSSEPQIRNLRVQIHSVNVLGPTDERFFVKPAGYEQFFPKPVPPSNDQRRAYARELLSDFASRAFRRPVDDASSDRLVQLAESIYSEGLDTFEAGIAKGMTAILASPRFLFREESTTHDPSNPYPLLDEYSLASRLSYFLWSSMPDSRLIELARKGMLRRRLDDQVARMLSDDKSAAFAENFVGQWLRARAIDTIPINSGAVLGREPRNVDPESDLRRRRFFELFRKGEQRTEEEESEYIEARRAFRRSFRGGPRFSLTPEVRLAMRRETEMLFEYIVQNDRSLLELVDNDYTFLNESLWGHYQLDGVGTIEGDAMRLVNLPPGSVRGGVLTQGTVLAVTSNPDRTSPVKRGLFILENLLGSPPAAPPPNIPALEDIESDDEQPLSLRETLAIHRENVLCSSCHNRMDPLGLALENFNALGNFRTEELGQPIEPQGVLATGESFANIRELKRILVTKRRADLYRCMTEKMMTYALGRAIEYTDAHTVDELVSSLESSGGKASVLIDGIIHSSAFQRTRPSAPMTARDRRPDASSSALVDLQSPSFVPRLGPRRPTSERTP